MKKIRMFCISLEPNHYKFIKDLGYTPVGLGEKIFDDNWLSDKPGLNISRKNKHYGEYTFHYWMWKNYLDSLDGEWFGFCQYRKFWSLKKYEVENINIKSLESQVLKELREDLSKYDTILGDPIFINQFKPMKFIKKGLKCIVKKPSTLFSKKARNIQFHFDLMHGENNLTKAINLLDKNNKEDFNHFVNTEVSFNPHNMFICRSKEKLKKYYEDLFPWLEKCEKLFGFENLKGFGKIRIYTFLAERFMPYWFRKNTKSTTIPIIFYDIRKDLNHKPL